jgi:hypothetical protein
VPEAIGQFSCLKRLIEFLELPLGIRREFRINAPFREFAAEFRAERLIIDQPFEGRTPYKAEVAIIAIIAAQPHEAYATSQANP